MSIDMNGLTTVHKADVVFVMLPPELWRPIDKCRCTVCERDGTDPYWDTLAVPKEPGSINGTDWTWMVHKPELYTKAERMKMSAMMVSKPDEHDH